MKKKLLVKKKFPRRANEGVKKKFLSLITSIFLLGSIQQSKAQAGAALNFDGVNDQVSIGTAMNSILAPLNKITVEAWIYPTSTTGSYKTIIGNYSNPANQMQFDVRLQQNSVVFFVNCGAGYQFAQTAVNTVTLNTWQHVACVWDGSKLNIYINGALLNSASGVTGPSFVSTTNSVVIGGNTVPEMFVGSLDEIRIWTRALCQGEIQNNMNGELPLPQTGLLAYYQFNEGTASGSNSTVTTLNDASGNSYNGTLMNFALTGASSNWIAPGGVTSGVNAPAFVPPGISIAGPNIIGTGGSATFTASGVSTYTWSANAGSATTSTVTVTPTTTTTYSVVGTNSLGCIGSAVQTLSVNPLGAALNFDGVNDQVPIGTAMNSILAPLNKITVEAWIYPVSTTGSYKTIVGNYSTPANQMQFDVRLQQNSVVFFVNCGAGYQFAQTAVNTVTLNTWQHVACVWDGSKLNIYINGALLNSASGVTGPSFVSTTNSVVIGGNSVPEMFNGSLDEIRIWTRALCQGEIQNNMNGELSLPQTGLLAYYQFNEGVSAASNPTVTTLTDASGNSYNGTLTNFALTGASSNWVAPGGVTSGVNAPAFVAPSISISGGSVAICAGTTTTLTANGNVATYTWTTGPTTAAYAVTPTVSTTYSVVGTNSVGCNSNMAMQTVTVNASPTVAVNSGSICAGKSFTMVPSGASTYTIQGGTAVVSPTANATYTVTGTSTAGCVSANTATSSVTVNPNPTVTAVSSATNYICVGQTATLTAAGATSYVWNTTATTSAIPVNPTVTTTYSVTGTGANGCTNMATVTQSVSTCTGINNVAVQDNGLHIYPNPSNGVFTISVASPVKIEICDLLGRTIEVHQLEEGDHQIDLAGQPAGMYLVKCTQGESLKSMRLIKQ